MRTIKVSDKLTPWLTTDFKKLARTRNKLKSAAVKNKFSILMNSYKHVRNKVNNLAKSSSEITLPNKLLFVRGI